MKRWIHFAIVLAVSIGCRTAPAQTVESVLRALQERQMALEIREHYESGGAVLGIVWPGGITQYPADGSVTELPKALAALNHASRKFDAIKGKYIAYDSHKHQLVNTSYAAQPPFPHYADEYVDWVDANGIAGIRSEEHTSELQSQ